MIPSVAARDGGPSEAVINLCEHLVALGLDVDLAYTTTPNDEEEFRATVRTMIGPHFSAAEFRRIGTPRFKYAPHFSGWIKRHASHYDLVHIHAIFSHLPLAASSALRQCGTPYVLRPLGTLSPYGLQRHATFKRLLLTLGARKTIADAAAIHCTSAEEEREIRERFDVRRTFVVPNGVDDALFEVARDDHAKVALYIGRLHPKKNVDILIDAFARAAKAPWRLIICGDGDNDYVQLLHQKASALPVPIEFAGWVGRERKRELLSAASLFILPSASENFAIAVAEAMAAGIPVVVSPTVGLAQFIEKDDCGWVSAPTTEALAHVLTEVMSSGALTTKGENARRVSRREFRWAEAANRLVELYHELRPLAVQSARSARSLLANEVDKRLV